MALQQHTVVVGSGFAGLAGACFLAKAGQRVTVLEKNETPGGRARMFEAQGFRFDMGPSWYWMPDVFSRFFAQFGKRVEDYYDLRRLDPSYTVWWQDGTRTEIPAEYAAVRDLFERTEPGAARRLDQFMAEAEYKYNVGIKNLVYKPGRSLLEFADAKFLAGLFRLQVFGNMAGHIRKYFRHPQLVQLMEFPVLFLGALPQNTPALYSLMNYADVKLGTWYPMGGMHKIVEAMVSLATELGVEIRTSSPATAIEIAGNRATGITTPHGTVKAQTVLAAADYHHVEQHLLPPGARQYSEAYWQSRTLAPSSLIFYLGLDTRLPELTHHALFFDTDFDRHAREIYATPQWPSDPLFYVCTASRTDSTVAPPGGENVFILIPTAVDLTDDDATRQRYFDQVLARLEARTGRAIRPHVVFRRDYAHRDFVSDYNSFRGNAYGLANTLRQTAILKPGLKSPKVRNLFYAGQLTVPGPGVPPSLISGEVAAGQILKQHS